MTHVQPKPSNNSELVNKQFQRAKDLHSALLDAKSEYEGFLNAYKKAKKELQERIFLSKFTNFPGFFKIVSLDRPDLDGIYEHSFDDKGLCVFTTNDWGYTNTENNFEDQATAWIRVKRVEIRKGYRLVNEEILRLSPSFIDKTATQCAAPVTKARTKKIDP